MAKNYIGKSTPINVEVSGDVSSGDGALIENQFVIYQTDGEPGDLVAVEREGVWEYAKASGQSWSQFETLYYDESEDEFTTTATDNTKCAVAAEAATSSATTGKILLQNAAAL